ncbi:cation efflux protein [Tothia fuscella]|uniref:Cation efflux protein n=1 Tax=Tothia fuscella TaxID=1048955 RepID=A0A9P4NLH8_9PEZI|nr:cation efflux protein [Tothia fuscella]
MTLSKSRRIQILLAIDGVFFFLELFIGYAVHSLALVADSFHMLNDVLSLCVGLWAVKVAGEKTSSKMYTYGWQRAETLGALVNGVFLVALCMTIFLEAIQRFVEPQEVSQPVLVLIVGCFGLASNIVGLFLFHDHGHSHGGGGHSHAAKDQLAEAEEGHAHSDMDESAAVADESGNIADVLPQSRIGNWPSTQPQPQDTTGTKRNETPKKTHSTSDGVTYTSAPSTPYSKKHQHYHNHNRSRSRGYSGLGEIPIHPASFRNEIIAAGRLEDVESGSGTEGDTDAEREEAIIEPDLNEPSSEQTPLLSNGHKHGRKPRRKSLTNGALHKSHNHPQPTESGQKGGHSHSDLNMRGVFLHVMGDALGNIGVIGSALFIWLTDFSWRFYSDPAISLIITVIILCSAIPLCKAASRILLQAVPAGLSVDDIKEDILALPDVVSCHHLHVWQLSDTKLVASLHVQVAFEFKGEGSQRYMQLARQIRKCLHEYGIHSSTIQPEFCCEATHGHRMIERAHLHAGDDMDSCEEEARDIDGGDGAADAHGCLLDCDDECGDGGKCCAPGGNDAPASITKKNGKGSSSSRGSSR